MQYKVLKIEEDIDFGCEERQPGENLCPLFCWREKMDVK